MRPLRKEILRPEQSAAKLVFPGDDATTTLHLAVHQDGQIVGVASVMSDPHPRRPHAGDWRIRGMATRAEVRSRGVGAALLSCCESHVREHGGDRLWCNARAPARAFYERGGFIVEGDVFEIAEIGPHYLMSKALRSDS